MEQWIKSKLPRSLFGRAMLILAVPIVVIQIVVAAFFAERLFRDVSEQMSSNVSLDVNHIVSQINDAPDRIAAISEITNHARPLNVNVSLPIEFSQTRDTWEWFDLSGKYVVDALRLSLPNLVYVDLKSDRKLVRLGIKSSKGPIQMSFARTRASATNPHQLLVAMILTSVLFTGISVLFLNNQIRPIKRLSDAAEAFGRGWSIPFHPRGAREVRSAGHSFLSMRARIIRQIDQRTMMLSGVSHDLRTPLTRMKLSLELLEPSEEVQHLERDVDEMEAMLTEFLEFARGDSGEKTETVGVKALIKRIIRNYARANEPVELVFNGITAGEETIKCRERAIQRAIENLIGNAIRYGEKARITVSLDPKHVDFTVEDAGPGIPKDKRNDALEPFTRLDEARNQNKGSGSGLGLAIAADVARSHGGKLELFHSQDLGGLKAILSIPR
ncbi:HAMP domain-containing protein [Amylibacter sp. SFDW26]|nr:HAMP domain-containing protein [Amylibacter sp. SFDW26]